MRTLATNLKARLAWLLEPAGENDLLLMKQVTTVAKWAVSVGGVSLAIAISLSVSAYTSFIQVYDKCESRMIASDAILGGSNLALFAIIGAVSALLGIAWPQLNKQYWYNYLVKTARRQGTSPPRLADWHPTTLTAILSNVLVFIGCFFVLFVPWNALSISYRQTPDGLAKYIQKIDARCHK